MSLIALVTVQQRKQIYALALGAKNKDKVK